ncbi:MAG: hypothetical protein ACJAS2_001727 [Pseudohongiellaceae bacterium]
MIERTFIDSDIEVLRTLGNTLFPSEGYEVEDVYAVYEPITYFDEMGLPLFYGKAEWMSRSCQKRMMHLFRY